jgi:PTH1 family peptidyl-tRNA hydrolase
MSYIIVGLGNPGQEYENTRHNAGRIVLEAFRKKIDSPDWEKDGRLNALVSEGKVAKLAGTKGKTAKVMLVEPETFMNKSGTSVKSLVTSIKKASEELVVVHDDLDLPLGRIKISFNKSSGGHRGVESIIKAIKTEAFTRVRIGISAATAKGVVKKPQGEEAIMDFIIGPFKPKELDLIKKVSKQAAEALTVLVTEGRECAMGEVNSK